MIGTYFGKPAEIAEDDIEMIPNQSDYLSFPFKKSENKIETIN